MASDMAKQRFVRAWLWVPDGVLGWAASHRGFLVIEATGLAGVPGRSEAAAGADRASFPGLGDPASAGPVAQLVRAHA